MILYVLMRMDVPSYASGKHMAQSNHAGTHLMWAARRFPDHSFQCHLDEWLDQAGGFGTCVTKAVTYRQLRDTLHNAKLANIFHGIVHDPSYPVADGDLMQHLPVDTCGYIFRRFQRVEPLVREFPRFREPC